MAARKIRVNTGVAADFIENVIARDITTMASIFDLIDNSIDAAKEQMFLSKDENGISLDDYNMPSDYHGYAIDIVIGNDFLSVEDNCLGIAEEILKDHAFRVGEQSDHEYGLGKYGIGLKRALFKFGTQYHLTTDTGRTAFEMEFNNKDLGGVKEVEATEIKTTGKPFTRFKVQSLKESVIEEFSTPAWTRKLESEISSRYSLFIDKGLQINLKIKEKKRQEIRCKWPDFHKEHPLIPSGSKHLTHEDVDIYIEYGLHTEFKLKAKYGVNNQLIKDGSPFGWFVICNDRVIEMAIREGEDYGWSKAWHNEYNGFVGHVRFNSKSVDSLPWDSTKTKIVKEDLIFLKLKDILADMAMEFRRSKKAALKTIGSQPEPDSKPEQGQEDKRFNGSQSGETERQKDSSSAGTKSTSSNFVDDLVEEKRSKQNSRGINNPDTRLYITDGKYRIPLSDKNLKRVFNELTSLVVEEKTMAVALLARVFLENLFKSYYQHLSGNPPSPKWQTHQVVEKIVENIKKEPSLDLAPDEKKALAALNNIASNPHSPLSSKTLGSNAHLAFYPKARDLKIEWDNIDAIIAYFAEKIYNS